LVHCSQVPRHAAHKQFKSASLRLWARSFGDSVARVVAGGRNILLPILFKLQHCRVPFCRQLRVFLPKLGAFDLSLPSFSPPQHCECYDDGKPKQVSKRVANHAVSNPHALQRFRRESLAKQDIRSEIYQ